MPLEIWTSFPSRVQNPLYLIDLEGFFYQRKSIELLLLGLLTRSHKPSSSRFTNMVGQSFNQQDFYPVANSLANRF